MRPPACARNSCLYSGRTACRRSREHVQRYSGSSAVNGRFDSDAPCSAPSTLHSQSIMCFTLLVSGSTASSERLRCRWKLSPCHKCRLQTMGRLEEDTWFRRCRKRYVDVAGLPGLLPSGLSCSRARSRRSFIEQACLERSVADWRHALNNLAGMD
jgi:hypothetical protein